jgi:hypothetical protein
MPRASGLAVRCWAGGRDHLFLRECQVIREGQRYRVVGWTCPVLLVSDSDLNDYFSLLGTAMIATGTASSYTAAGGNLTAQFLPGPGTEMEVEMEVEVDSASCTVGAHPGVCLEGILNSNGQYTATAHGLTTSANIFKNSGTTDSAALGGGSITYQTPARPSPARC